eukprot:7208066-Ditylum_brightwellii.AAC.1
MTNEESIEYIWANSKYYLRTAHNGKRGTAQQGTRLHWSLPLSQKCCLPSPKITTLSMKDIEKSKRIYCSHWGVEKCNIA